MTIITISVIGIGAVLLAVQLKSGKAEYGIYMAFGAGAIIFFYSLGKAEAIVNTLKEIRQFIRLQPVYFNTLLKMIGITYVAEFSAGICKDSGYSAVGNQIEIFAKLSVLAVSMPILTALFETLEVFLS